MAGTLLVVPFLAQILRDRRAPGSTFAWLLSVVLIPYIGVPLYLAFGPRKRSRETTKRQLRTNGDAPARPDAPRVARLLAGEGVAEPTDGNTFELLATGESAYEKLIELVDGAERSIHVATFILADDRVGNAVLERLTRRAAEGVRVRVLVDGLFMRFANRRHLADLRRAGGSVVEFAPMIHMPFRGMDNLRNHRKIVVVDGTEALVGGMNIAEEYMGPEPLPSRWRDVALYVRGPTVANIADVARSDWAFASKEDMGPIDAPARLGNAAIQVVPSGPDSVDDALYEALLAACYWATDRIWVATPYFVPDDALARALSAAARRGLDVRIVVPARSNHVLADYAGGTYLRQVQAAGGRIETYPTMMHAKVVVIDGEFAVVGSANFDMRSLLLNYEIALFLYSADEVNRMRDWFVDVFARCSALAPASRTRAIAEDVGRLLGPIL
jgi:cardiolipin synthase